MDYRFFGLTLDNAQEFRYNLFTQIHNIVYHGNGGYDWYSVYNMPIWMRNFHTRKISEYNKKQNEEMKKQNSQISSEVAKGPNINPSSIYNIPK